MSELINIRGRSFRRHLLTTVSAMSLTAVIFGNARASDKPSVWIELGGQLERIDGSADSFQPPFTLVSPVPTPYSPISPAEAQKSPIYSYGAEGRITLRPDGSDWNFSVAVRYGRSNNRRHIHQQTKVYDHFLNPDYGVLLNQPRYKTATAAKFSDVQAKNYETHAVVDFQAGRDVGLGIFSTTVNFGIRVADFTSKSHANLIARPQIEFKDVFYENKYRPGAAHTDYMAEADNGRSFRGVGPSVSWEGNVPVYGGQDGAITLDWGVNAAALFGRQKAKGSHQTTARYYNDKYYQVTVPPLYANPAHRHDRSRSVIVPNIGGLAGISFRYSAAKISFGYRADLFLGAMDTGIDSHHTVNRNFYGPFATISIGLGG